MDVLSLLISLVQSVSGVPMVAKVLLVIVMGAGVAASLASALVALWHSLVLIFQAIGLVSPACTKIADKLAADEAKINDFEQGKLLPILNRLSAIPLPKK